MWWKAVVDGANGLLQGMGGRAEAKANNRLSALNSEVGNKLRAAENANTAAQNGLSRWVQSVNNNKQLDAGGDNLEANTVNYYRQRDAVTMQGFSNSIRSAEGEGAASAAAAHAGVGGSVVDMVNASTRLRDSIVTQQMTDSTARFSSDAAQRAGRIMSQTIGGLDNSIIFDSLDYNVDVAKVTPIMSHFSNALQGAAKSLGVTGQGEDVMRRGSSTTFSTESVGGLATRQRAHTSIGGDLADQFYDNKMSFGFKAPVEESSSFSIGSAKLGGSSGGGSASPYSLWSG